MQIRNVVTIGLRVAGVVLAGYGALLAFSHFSITDDFTPRPTGWRAYGDLLAGIPLCVGGIALLFRQDSSAT